MFLCPTGPLRPNGWPMKAFSLLCRYNVDRLAPPYFLYTVACPDTGPAHLNGLTSPCFSIQPRQTFQAPCASGPWLKSITYGLMRLNDQQLEGRAAHHSKRPPTVDLIYLLFNIVRGVLMRNRKLVSGGMLYREILFCHHWQYQSWYGISRRQTGRPLQSTNRRMSLFHLAPLSRRVTWQAAWRGCSRSRSSLRVGSTP